MKEIFTKQLVGISFVSLIWASCNPSSRPGILTKTGQAIDSLNGVKVYFNGDVSHTEGRNLSHDGYNLGIKYQCVEFVKRYYYEHLNHKMPDSYGHAKSFFDSSLDDGSFNVARGLSQYRNGSMTLPRVNDLLIFDGNSGNPYGHVAIISAVQESSIEIIQQNPGRFGSSRKEISFKLEDQKTFLDHPEILGWLRKE